MNKETYLKKKSLIIEKKFRKICLLCRRPDEACFCEELSPISTKTKFIILMHPKEAKKEKVGTGRLTHIILKNSKIIIGENFDDNTEVQNLLKDDQNECMILYPGELAHNISKDKLVPQKNLVIFIIDGTWPCAKSMMRDSKTLHHIPKISFETNAESLFKIKQQPASYCLSTIESVFYLIEGLKKSEIERPNLANEELPLALDKLVSFQLNCANDPTRSHYRHKNGYKPPSLRTPSKKHMERKIVFDPENY